MPMGVGILEEHQTPTNVYLLEYLITLSVVGLISTCAFKSAQSPKKLIAAMGVAGRRVAKAVREIERKTFHITGLLVPLFHNLALEYGDAISPDRGARQLARERAPPPRRSSSRLALCTRPVPSARSFLLRLLALQPPFRKLLLRLLSFLPSR